MRPANEADHRASVAGKADRPVPFERSQAAFSDYLDELHPGRASCNELVDSIDDGRVETVLRAVHLLCPLEHRPDVTIERRKKLDEVFGLSVSHPIEGTLQEGDRRRRPRRAAGESLEGGRGGPARCTAWDKGNQ